MAKEIEVKVSGRILGTASGWDGDGPEVFWFYDFEPREGIDIPACSSLQFDLINGWFGVGNEDDGSIKEPKDICIELSKIAR